MHFKNLILRIIILSFVIVTIVSAEDELSAELTSLAQFVGKTWKGEFSNSTPEKPVFDVSKWERALNGTAVRVLHSVNDGEYGGESIIFYDKAKQSLVFYYFTTAGFFTTGTVNVADGAMTSHEFVTGNQNGITEVKSVSKVLPDGRLQGTSQYLKDGKWVDGHQIIYIESPESKVIFK